MKKRGGKRKGAGRKKTPIDLRLLTGLAAQLFDIQTIADLMKLPRKTLSDRIHNDPAVKEAFDAGKANLKVKASTLMLKHAERNPGACIFLCKNVLGMKDVPDLNESERRSQVLHIVFDQRGQPKVDNEKLAPPLPDPPDADAQDEAEAKALENCRNLTSAN